MLIDPIVNPEHRNIILQGNVVDWHNSIQPKTVDCVLTSPPYWAVRLYDATNMV